ncbi:MAG TPA: hypothetical protein VN764_10645 [Polyangiaceae bacterium]|nr:hypothetical protein [Polyangiaceae bacterium]
MDPTDERFIAAFSQSLVSLPHDVKALLSALGDANLQPGVKRSLACGANYLRKSLDLIDDGVEGLGYLDDAFIVRLLCEQAQSRGPLPDELRTLAAEAELVRGFLGPLYERAERYVTGLEQLAVRGRSVEAIVSDAGCREELTADLLDWAARYKSPQFVLDGLGLSKLRSFFAARLPN